MKPRRVAAMARKEFLHVLRDRRSLAMAVAIPVLMLLLFGYALTLDVDNVPLVLWDQSQTQASRDYVAQYTGSRYFSLKRVVWNYRDLEQAIDSSEALMALVIPRDFGQKVDASQNASVQVIVDGSDSNTATIALGYADIINLVYSQDMILRQFQRSGGRTLELPLDVRPRVWFNTDLESKNYIIPGLIAIIMMIIAALLTSLTVAREWERGTMEQLISTPVTAGELILGKLSPYFAIGVVDMALAVLMGQFLFDVPLRGNIWLLLVLSAIFLIGVLSVGILISIVMKNQLVSSQLAIMLTFVPSYLLSGFVFAITNMPQFIQTVTYLIPARYFIAILKGIYLKGIGLELLAWDVALLIIFGCLTVVAAKMKFKKKLT